MMCSRIRQNSERTMTYISRGRKRVRRAERREPSGTSFLCRQADACRSPIVSLMTARSITRSPTTSATRKCRTQTLRSITPSPRPTILCAMQARFREGEDLRRSRRSEGQAGCCHCACQPAVGSDWLRSRGCRPIRPRFQSDHQWIPYRRPDHR